MEAPTFQELKHIVLQTFDTPAWFLPSSISYWYKSETGFERVTVERKEYMAHASLKLAVTKDQLQHLQEPELSLTLPFVDGMVAPSICIYLTDWMLGNTFVVVCFVPEATEELTYKNFGMVNFNLRQNNGVWKYTQVGKLLQGENCMLTVQPFCQAAALLGHFMNLHFR